MHVTIVSQYFWPEAFRINDFAAWLVARGHQVCVLTGQPSYPRRGDFSVPRPRRETIDRVQVVRVPMASRGAGDRRGLAANYLSYAASASLLGPARLSSSTDVLFVFQMSPVSQVLPALVLRRTCGAPVVTWVQDLWPQSVAATGAVRSPAAIKALGLGVGSLYRRSDCLLVQSEAFRDPLVRTGVAADRIHYLPNWAEAVYQPTVSDVQPIVSDVRSTVSDAPTSAISTASPASTTTTSSSFDLPDGFVVVFAGNIGRAQSMETLIGAAERLRSRTDLHWVVVGDGVRRDWLANEVNRRGLGATVHLLDRRPVEQMPALFARADALLVTLARDPLMAMTVPSRLQSYLACGRPVVAALDGEGARVVRAAGSLVVPAEDAAGLARIVDGLRTAPAEQLAAHGAAARRYYLDHFDRGMLLCRAEALLADTVEQANRRANQRRPRRRQALAVGGQ